MKTKTIIVLVLAVFAGVLSAVAFATPEAHAVAGSVHGGVYWVDQSGNMRPMSWAQVTADDGASPTVVASTTEGSYVLWLAPGTYNITASSDAGFYPDYADNVVVSPGSSISIDFTLEPTGEPVPELPPWAQPLILLSAIAITVVSVRRYRARPRA